MKETGYTVLTVLIAVEIWVRTFWSFPRARVRVGFVLIVALLGTAVAVSMLPTDLHPYDLLMGVLIPRQNAGTLALCAALVSAAFFYRVPLHPFHRALLIGFAACLTVQTPLLSLVGLQSGSVSTVNWSGALNAAASVAAAGWWAWAACRPTRVPSPIVSRMQPWAGSW